jgi:hypothetical protein
MKRILVADVPPMDERYSAALGGWQVEFVRTLQEARQALRGARYDALAVGVYFDDSRMFDLLRLLRADARNAATPALCVRGRAGPASVSAYWLETAVKALGAGEFVDLPAGEDGARALRAAAERLISSAAPT